jgi:hypothetical protein
VERVLIVRLLGFTTLESFSEVIERIAALKRLISPRFGGRGLEFLNFWSAASKRKQQMKHVARGGQIHAHEPTCSV